jgi:hypothetical protein
MALGNPGKGRSLKTARLKPCDAFVAHVPDVSHRALFFRCRRKDQGIGEVGLIARKRGLASAVGKGERKPYPRS